MTKLKKVSFILLLTGGLMMLLNILGMESRVVAQTLRQELELIDTHIPDAAISDIDTQGTWSFSTSTTNLKATASQIIRWGASSRPSKGPLICVTDGSLLPISGGRIETNQVVVRLADWNEIVLPRNIVRGIIFQVPGSAKQWQELIGSIYSETGTEDILLARSGDRRLGVLSNQPDKQSVWDYSSTNPSLYLSQSGATRNTAISDIVAVIFSPTLTPILPASKNQIQIGWRDGTLLNATRITADSDQKLEVKLISGPSLRTLDNVSDIVTNCEYVWVNNNRAAYISDDKPASYRHIPLLGSEWGIGENQDLFGGPILMDSRKYPKGLAMHSASQAAYRVPSNAIDFRAKLDFVDAALLSDRSLANVTAQVLILAGGKLEKAESSPKLSPDSQGWRVIVPLTGRETAAQAIVLVIEYGDHADIADHVVWLDARFTLPNP